MKHASTRSAASAEWHVVETPFDEALHDVVQTVAGPHAVGASGTLVADTGDGWAVVLDDGPTASNNVLTAADVTDDGQRVWFLGGGGVLGCYDVTTGRKYDYSFPKEMTTSWTAVAVSGKAGSEKALAANTSGEVLPFVVDGFDVDWAPVTKPGGSGATVAALAASPNGVGYAVDHSGNAYGTTDEGWEDIGIVNAQVALNGITAGAGGRVYVAGGDGRLYRYDDSYRSWTPIDIAGTALRAVGIDGERLLTVGANGALYQRDGDTRWRKAATPTDTGLHDVALGETDVVVGDRGIVLERPGAPGRASGDARSSSGSQTGGAKKSGSEEKSGSTKKSDGATRADSTKESGDEKTTGGEKKSGSATQSGGTGQTGGHEHGHTRERERLDRVRADARFVVAVADAERLAAGVADLVVAEDACGTDYLVVLD